MFCSINKIIDSFSYGTSFSPAFVPWYKPRPFAFSKMLMAGQLSMVQYQFHKIDHGFLICIIHKNIKGNKVISVISYIADP